MQYKNHRGTEYAAFSKRLASWLAIFVMTAGASLAYSQTAYAGLLSFWTNLVGADQASANITSDSSVVSNDYLQAPANSDPNPSDSPGVAPIADNTLFPDMAVANSTTSEPVNTDIGTYTVQPGDTISSIASMFNISAGTIRQANGLSGSTIQPGEVLTILPRSGIIYTIEKGDTLGSIAKKYSADVNDILNYNNIASSSLVVGTAIMIPDAEMPAPTSSSSGSKVGGSTYRRIMAGSFEPLLDNIANWPSYPGYYSCPIAPGVGRLSQALHGHNAVDLAAPIYTPIHAAAAGTVIIDRVNGAWNGGYGNFVVISHPNGTQTLYAHMAAKSKGLVSLGDTVSQDQPIGYIGMTGLTTGPHVHFEVRGAQNSCLYYH